jgi:nitrogen fixation protein FixH
MRPRTSPRRTSKRTTSEWIDFEPVGGQRATARTSRAGDWTREVMARGGERVEEEERERKVDAGKVCRRVL